MTPSAIGYKALVEKLTLSVIPHYRESYIAFKGRGKVIIHDHHETHIYPKTYALKNDSDLLAHLEFALKHDGINIEIIKAVLMHIDKEKIVQFILKQPTGIYTRKIWFFYEYLLDDVLPIKDSQRIKYIDLLDPKIYFTGDNIKSSRHAVNNNLLGNQQFCPLVRRTKILDKFIKLNLDNKAKLFLRKYDPHLIARTCNYLYTKETMSSYEIEKEQPEKTRMVRFINLLQKASTIDKLTKKILIELQNVIVDPRFKNFDYRHMQNYVGENINPYWQKIHFISPKPEDVAELMQALLFALERMLHANVHPVIIATVISFGFVFIHPFEDGNGRIHRFLIHYILSRKNFTPKELIFPISSVMLKNIYEYDMILESFSKPLMTVLTQYQLSDEGVMAVQQESKSYYQYIDFTFIVEYLFSCIEEALYKYIKREIQFLLNYDQAKKAIQELIDMPDAHIDLFIKLVTQNNGKLAKNKKDKFFPLLSEEEVQSLTEMINTIFMLDKRASS